jgi:hypothetical protein
MQRARPRHSGSKDHGSRYCLRSAADRRPAASAPARARRRRYRPAGRDAGRAYATAPSGRTSDSTFRSRGQLAHLVAGGRGLSVPFSRSMNRYAEAPESGTRWATHLIHWTTRSQFDGARRPGRTSPADPGFMLGHRSAERSAEICRHEVEEDRHHSVTDRKRRPKVRKDSPFEQDAVARNKTKGHRAASRDLHIERPCGPAIQIRRSIQVQGERVFALFSVEVSG